MQRRSLALVALLAGCTFLTEVTPPASDVAGGSGQRQPDAGARSGSVAGNVAIGGVPNGDASAGAGTDPLDTDPLGGEGSGDAVLDAGGVVGGCTGCVQLRVPSRRPSDYQLAFATPLNLQATALHWRVRVLGYVGDVELVPYADSGDLSDEEATSGMLTLTEAQGWQDIVLDLAQVSAFRSPGVVDAGYDRGFSFDKRRVLRVGLALQPGGLANRALVEIDSLTFSDAPELDLDFARNAGGLELIDSPGASAMHVPE